jgi:hypothetical protein
MLKQSHALLISACALARVGCGQGPGGSTVAAPSAYLKEVAAESLAIERSPDTTYRRRVKDVIARSRVVPVDSLARMFAALSHAGVPDQPRLRQGIMCEDIRLILIHGPGAFKRAKERMEDSLTRAGVDLDASMRLLYEGAGPPLEVSDRVCPALPDAQLPDSLQGEPQPTAR